MGGDPRLWLAVASGLGAVAVLRLSWGRPLRSPALNAAGWLWIGVGLVAGAQSAGVWGMAIATLPAMGLALALLMVAAARSGTGRDQPSNRRAGMLPQGNEPLHLRHRIATFLLVGLAAPASAIALSVALREAAVAAGLTKADANALALFAQPLAWAVLASAVLLAHNRRKQLAILLGTAAPLIPALFAALMSAPIAGVA